MGADDLLYPLNLAWGVLFWKQQAEGELQRSGLRHCVVRPGGLSNDAIDAPLEFLPRGSTPGGRVSRANVAKVVCAALTNPDADGKVVEVVQRAGAPARDLRALFAGA